MYLSKLELHGFKSFADRTVVNFAPGVTVVVGPNGCGKSNVVDAVRWVIGEQRARILRSEKMENVIFNGAGHRKALGVAEVMLTIENNRGVLPTEYQEVTIGRRLYRSGESEYLLNGTQCRLKDITDLFMDTGMGAGAYSVIELKMIEELLSDNALDRRRLFEEAAGITKYKIRRTQTLRKLKSTQVDLTRVRDLTEELDRRVRSLERQAKKASRYKRHRGRLTELELALAQHRYDALVADRERCLAASQEFKAQLEQDGAALAKREASHEALRTRHIEREQALVSIQTRLSAHVEKLRAAESDQRLVVERLAVTERDILRLGQEQESAAERSGTLAESLETLETTIAGAQPAADEAEAALDIAREARDLAVKAVETKRVAVQKARAEERKAAEALAQLRRTLDRSSSRIEMMQEELAGLDERETVLNDQLEQAERHAADKSDAVEIAETAVADAAKAVEEAAEQKQLRSDRLAELKEQLAVAQRRMDAVDAEVSLLESLLSSYDDFSESVQFLAGESDWTSDELVTVADVIGCDASIRPAVESALGEYASCLVVATEAEASRAISKLKESEKGRTTFVILDRLPDVPTVSTPAGLSPLLESVRYEPRYERLVRVLLQDAFLADDLEQALRLSATGVRCFTGSGEWVQDGGVVHAGSETASGKSGGGRIGRREQLEKSRLSLDEAQKAVEALRSSAEGAQRLLAEVLLPQAEKHHRESLSEQSTARSAHARAVLERDNVARRAAELQKRRKELAGSVETIREDIAGRSVAVEEAQERLAEWEGERSRVEEAFQQLEQDGRAAIGRFSEANVTAVQARNHLENVRRDLVRVQQEIVRLEQEREARKARLVELEEARVLAGERIEFLEKTIAELHDGKVLIERDVVTAKDALSQVKVEISEIEAEIRVLRRTRDQHVQEENALAVRLAEIQTRSENLVTVTLEEFELDLESTRVEAPEDFDPKAAPELVQKIRQKIRGLGPVNELALETFEEEKERLDFMQAQLQDLEGAESTLMETISEINTTASDRFDKTFAAIQVNFSRLFEDLFGEDASARVVLQDEDDPLESDIEVFAKPRGKKPSVLAQLSGGEKTLTAIALLFAIYLVKPSPFCILDEVDAPLDDANVDRFMDLIRTFAESTQFVLVTHNKRTMEAADRMYGITMQQQGVSSLVGVEFGSEVGSDMELVA